MYCFADNFSWERRVSPPSRASGSDSRSTSLGSEWSRGLVAAEWDDRKYENPCPEFSAEVAQHLEEKLTDPSVLLIILNFAQDDVPNNEDTRDTIQTLLLGVLNQKTSLPLVLTTLIHEYLKNDFDPTPPRDDNIF